MIAETWDQVKGPAEVEAKARVEVRAKARVEGLVGKAAKEGNK